MAVSPELDRLLAELVGEERQRIYEQVGQPLTHTFRFNPLKGDPAAQARLLREQGFQFEPIDGFPQFFRILHQPYPIGKSLSHFLGHIYVQDLASMIPPLVLDPKPGEWVLDMSAAPGSKTTQMAAMMDNRGVILANDVAAKRVRALITNLQRMGIVNTVVYQWFGEQFGNQYFEQFDRVLLDPACSGLGTLHKNPEVLSWWTPAHCERLAAGQRQLLISAIKATRPGGIIVYSTCTLTPQENEAVIHDMLERFPVELCSLELPGLKTHPGLTRFGNATYHPSLEKAIRIYPFDNNTEGFFIARLRKTDSLPPPQLRKPVKSWRAGWQTRHTAPVKKYLDFLQHQFDWPEAVWQSLRFHYEKRIVAVSAEMADFPLRTKPVYMGLVMANIMSRGARLTTEGAQLLGALARRNVVQLNTLEELEQFVNREDMEIGLEGQGQVLVRYAELVIGYGLAVEGRLRSQFPKAEWPFHLTT